MPATRLTSHTVNLAEYDIVGQDGETPFVRHVGLSAVNGDHPTLNVPVHEMGPPLNSPGLMEAHVHGTASLDDNERQKVKSFIDRHRGEHASRQLANRKNRSYIIHPHMREEAEEDETYSHTRFSCVGFVVEAYRFARIDLMDLGQIPPASIAEAGVAYPDIARKLQSSELLREWYGLAGAGPWPIIFAGYVVHALARLTEQIRQARYIPRAEDLLFP